MLAPQLTALAKVDQLHPLCSFEGEVHQVTWTGERKNMLKAPGELGATAV